MDVDPAAATCLTTQAAGSIGKALSCPGTPVRLTHGDIQWPIDIIIGKGPPDLNIEDPAACQTFLSGKEILVIGATLGNWAVPVPARVLDTCVVLLLRTFTGRTRYGFRVLDYASGDRNCWECETDDEPCSQFWHSVEALRALGVKPSLKFLGVSAGVDMILSIVATQVKYTFAKKFRTAFFTAIAGAYHPTLYDDALRYFERDVTRVLVHHHVDDKLCPWGPVKQAWSQASPILPIYINALRDIDPCLIDGKRHDVAKFLCNQPAFWTELLRDESIASSSYRDRCYHSWLGQAHRDGGTGIIEGGYDAKVDDQSHFLALGLHATCAAEAARRQMQQPGRSVTDWAVALVTNARILHTPPCKQYLDAFLASVPEYTGIAATVTTCVPALLAEGLLQNFQQKSPEVYQAGRMQSVYVVSRCLWRVGPMALVHLTFPAERNESKWVDLTWTQRAQIRTEDLPRRPLSPQELQALAGQENDEWRHPEDLDGWVPLECCPA